MFLLYTDPQLWELLLIGLCSHIASTEQKYDTAIRVWGWQSLGPTTQRAPPEKEVDGYLQLVGLVLS